MTLRHVVDENDVLLYAAVEGTRYCPVVLAASAVRTRLLMLHSRFTDKVIAVEPVAAC
jgi:hypothetical protein